jgi:surface glycoprotein (TIGR04207 family)
MKRRAILLSVLMVLSVLAGPAAVGTATQPDTSDGGTASVSPAGTFAAANDTVENETSTSSDDDEASTENETSTSSDDDEASTENETSTSSDDDEASTENETSTEDTDDEASTVTAAAEGDGDGAPPSAGKSLELNGRGWATVADNDTIDVGGDDALTLELWIKPRKGSAENALVLHKKGSWELELRGTGEERAIQFNDFGFDPDIVSDTGLPVGVWTHVAFVADGSQWSLYLNGELDSQFSSSSVPENGPNDLQFGTNDARNAQFYVGSVDNVRIWDDARNFIEVQDNRFVELDGTESDLAALYQFDGQPAGGPVADVAGVNEMTLSGDAAVVDGDSNPTPPHITAVPKNQSVSVSIAPRDGIAGNNDATEYRLYRATDPQMSDRQLVTTLSAGNFDSIGYDGYGLENGRTYYYQVTAVDGDGEGDYSKPAAGTPYGEARVFGEEGSGGGGGSLALDGRGYAELTDRPSLDNLAGGAATFEVWVKPDRTSDANAYIYQKKGAFSLTWNGVGEERTVTFNVPGFNPSITSDSGVHAGEWTHITVVIDGSQWSMYVDGELDSQISTGSTVGSSGRPLHLGANDAGNDRFYVGRIDEFRAWDAARSDDDIAFNYTGRIHDPPSTLQNYFRFDAVGNETARGSTFRHGTMSFVGGAGIEHGGSYPVAPQAQAESGNGSVTVTWHLRGDARDSRTYKIYRSTDPSGVGREVIGSVEGTYLTGTPNASHRTFVDTNVTNGRTYYYEVTRVAGDEQESDFQRPVSATPYSEDGGASLSLDGSSYGNVSDRASIDNLGDGAASIEFWVKPKAGSDGDAYVLQKKGAFDVTWVGTGEDRQVRFNVPGFNPSITSDSGVPADVWTHVAVVVDGSQWSLYLDGELDSQISTGSTIGSSGNPLHIGANNAGNDRFFEGNVDNLRLWDDARNQSEVEDSYDTLLEGDEQALVHYWRFDDPGVSRSRSTEAKHSEVEMIDGAAVAAPGVHPVPPRVYARSDDATAEVLWRVRARDASRDVRVYAATQRDLGDRQLLTAVNASRRSTFTESNLTNGQTRFYQATAVDHDGQESDYAFEAGTLPSTQPAGNAFRFSGPGSFATVEDREALELEGVNEDEFTVQFWVNYREGSDRDAYVLNKDGSMRATLLGNGSSRQLEFNLIGGFQPSVRTSSGLAADEWHHVTVTADGSQLSMYVDGQLDSQTSFSGTLSDSSNPLRLGTNDAANGHFMIGELDGLRMWEDARTETEIRRNYDNELAGSEQGLVGYWRGLFTTGNDTVTGSARKPMTVDLTKVGAVPSGASIEQGGVDTTTVDVVLDGAPNGLQLYDLRVNATTGAPIRTVTPKLIDGQEFQVTAGGPGASSVTARGVDLSQQVGSFSDSRVLLTVEFTGTVNASDVEVTVDRLVDDSGNAIPAGRVNVTASESALFGSPIPGAGNAPPNDPDDDEEYEDVDGDGDTDFDDAIALAFADTSNLSADQREALDFDGDGDVDFDDAIALAFEV